MAVAIQNFRSVDRLMDESSERAAAEMDKLGPGGARALLRYHVAEQNRWYFENWERVQLGLALGLIVLGWSGRAAGRRITILGLGLMGLLLFERIYLTPEIVETGRLLDFVPQDQLSTQRESFGKLHATYSTLEIVKVAMIAALSFRLILRGSFISRFRRQPAPVTEAQQH